jgi:antitoxin YefM
MLSLEDYEALCETNFLLRSTKNRERLSSAIQSLSDGRGIEGELIE